MAEPLHSQRDAAPYCDVSLPVPVDRLFTYELPLTLRHRARAGSRVLVPFGNRRLIGFILKLRHDAGTTPAREVLRLLDECPVLDGDMLHLGQWIAEYYCAPLGEVLRGMLPLGGETRKTLTYALTGAGRDIGRQLSIHEDESATTRVIRLLDEKPRSLEYINRKIDRAKPALQSLLKRGWISATEEHSDRDPLRASTDRLRVEFRERPAEGLKLKKAERELLAFLELHPGAHELKDLTRILKKASEAARALARRELITLTTEMEISTDGFERPVPELNRHQQSAFESIAQALDARHFQPFLLQGVTGSGKTEVYMRAIEATLKRNLNALYWCPKLL